LERTSHSGEGGGVQGKGCHMNGGYKFLDDGKFITKRMKLKVLYLKIGFQDIAEKVLASFVIGPNNTRVALFKYASSMVNEFDLDKYVL
jgi:hypothetical protein